MFLQSRSLWQSTTGEPSVERCSFIHTISCSNTALLGTSCWILDRDTERDRYQSSDCSDSYAHLYTLLLAKTKSFSLFFFFLSSQKWDHMCRENNWERHAQTAHRLCGAVACLLLGAKLHRNKLSVETRGAAVPMATPLCLLLKLDLILNIWELFNRFVCILCFETHHLQLYLFCALFYLCAYVAGLFKTMHPTCVSATHDKHRLLQIIVSGKGLSRWGSVSAKQTGVLSRDPCANRNGLTGA